MEKRGQPRFELKVDVRVYSRREGRTSGHTLDLSESGISAMLLMDLQVGQAAGLDFELATEPVHVWAVVRNRVAFRYGFEFIRDDHAQAQIRSGCASLGQGAGAASERS
jgi:hypothetical protein